MKFFWKFLRRFSDKKQKSKPSSNNIVYSFSGITSDNVQKFVNWWNISFPFDHWFRNKYNIPFNSELHRQSNFIDEYIIFLEEKTFQDIFESGKEKKYEPGKMNWLLPKKYSESDIQDMFDNLDIENM